MKTIRLWRGNSRLDGEYIRVIEDVNRGRFYELAYSEKREKEYLNESTLCGVKWLALPQFCATGFMQIITR